MKKKIITFLVLLMIFVTGCDLENNPNAKVEEFLGNYQRLDDNVVISYTSLTPSVDLSEEQQSRYWKLIEDQYKNLVYELKDEKVDGDKATVTVEIEVTNFKKTMDKYNYASYSDNEYNNKLLDELESIEEKVQYTIDFELTKDDNGDWSVDDLTTEASDKLLGIY